jgi:hypothetical protein
MCHYPNTTVPVPAVNTVLFSDPAVVVLKVSPAPPLIVSVPGYMIATNPEPPALPVGLLSLLELPPSPVLVAPATAPVAPPPVPLVTALPVIVEL